MTAGFFVLAVFLGAILGIVVTLFAYMSYQRLSDKHYESPTVQLESTDALNEEIESLLKSETQIVTMLQRTAWHELLSVFLASGFYMYMQKYQKAIDCLSEALKHSRELNMTYLGAAALCNMSVIYALQEKWEFAITGCNEASNLFSSIGSVENQVACINNLAGIYCMKGDLDIGLNHYTQALNLLETQTNVTIKLSIISNIGSIETYQDQLIQARKHLKQALTMAQNAQDELAIAVQSLNLAIVEIFHNRHADAHEFLLVAEAIFEKYQLVSFINHIETIRNSQHSKNGAWIFANTAVVVFRLIGYPYPYVFHIGSQSTQIADKSTEKNETA